MNDRVKLQPRFLSIGETAEFLSISPWSVKDLLKRGVLKAKKSGRRTLVETESANAHADSLPAAKYLPPRRRVA
jgi:hypothetical protein